MTDVLDLLRWLVSQWWWWAMCVVGALLIVPRLGGEV